MRKVLFFFLALCMSFSAFASTMDTLYLDGYSNGLNDGSLYVGWENAHLGSAPAKSLLMYCIGAAWTALPNPQPIMVDAISLADLAGNPYGLTVSKAKQLAIMGTFFNNTQANDVDVQHEIWNVLQPGRYGVTALMASIGAYAAANENNYDYSKVLLYLSPNGTLPALQDQPFQSGVPTKTPEPATMLLSGMVVWAIFHTKKKGWGIPIPIQ